MRAVTMMPYMPFTTPDAVAVRVSSTRNYYKCDDCRQRKKKCVPELRDWEQQQQRCNNCIVADLECGPNKLIDRPVSHSATSSNSASNPLTPFSSQLSLSTSPSSYARSVSATSPNDQPWTTSTTVPPQWPAGCGWETTSIERPSPLRPGRNAFNPSENRQTGLQHSRPKDVVRLRLHELGDLCDLFRYTRKRLEASIQAQPRRHFPIYSDVESTLGTTLHTIRTQIHRTGEQILEQTIKLTSSDREPSLLKLFDRLDGFLNVPPVHLVTDVSTESMTENHRISTLQHATCQQLINLYETLQEPCEADRFRLRLASSYSRHHARSNHDEIWAEQRAFVNMSARLTAVYQTLDHEHRCLQLFPRNGIAFPATHLAAAFERLETARNLRGDSDTPTHEVDLMRREAAHIAVEAGDRRLLEAALEKSTGKNAGRDIYHMSPVFIAAYRGDVPILNDLSSAGFDLCARDITGRSVLTVACGSGQFNAVQYLLSCGCSPNESYRLEQSRLLAGQQSVAYSALHAAAAGGFLQIVELLLHHNASAVYVSNDRTPSQEAEAHGHHEVADMLKKAYLVEEKQLQLAAAAQISRTDFVHSLRNTSSMANSPSAASCSSSPPEHSVSLAPPASGQNKMSSASSHQTVSPQLSEDAMRSSSDASARKRPRDCFSRRSTPTPEDVNSTQPQLKTPRVSVFTRSIDDQDQFR